MVKKLLPILLALLMLPVIVLAEMQITDELGLLSSEEIEVLSDNIRKVEEVYVMDLAVLVTDSVPLDVSDDLHIVRDFADSYYDNRLLGMRANASGILYLLDMKNCVIWLSTSGDMIYYVNDAREEKIIDAIYDCVIKCDYAGSIKQFTTLVNDYLWQGIESGTYLYREIVPETQENRK